MTLFEAQPYDAARARKRRAIIVSLVVLGLVIGLVWWQMRFWPEERIVDRFFDALQQQDFDKAYGIWMHDPDWKQHPKQYARYPLSDFMKDWGPSGEWGIIKSHRIDGAGVPKGHGSTQFSSPSGVVVVVTVNERIADKAHVWVENDDKTLGFSPY